MLSIVHISALLVILGILIYEDFRFRLIHIWIFPVLGALFISFQYNTLEWWHPALNLAFLALQFILLTTWFSIKEKKFILITRSHLGSGDVALWCVVALLFSPLNFIIFFSGSLLGSLLLAVPIQLKSTKKIPLAGLQALFLYPVLICTFIYNNLNVRDDSFILTFLI